MGYQSTFDLTVYGTEYRELEAIYEYMFARKDDYYGLSELFEWGSSIVPEGDGYQMQIAGYERVKWYDYHVNMRDVSKKFPFALFILDIAGEESGDLRRAFYVNGESYEEGYIPPKFDMSKLIGDSPK